MIRKGYHYVITLGIFSNFYISIEPAYLEPCILEDLGNMVFCAVQVLIVKITPRQIPSIYKKIPL